MKKKIIGLAALAGVILFAGCDLHSQSSSCDMPCVCDRSDIKRKLDNLESEVEELKQKLRWR